MNKKHTQIDGPLLSDSSMDFYPWETQTLPFSTTSNLIVFHNRESVLLKLIDIRTKKILKSRNLPIDEFISANSLIQNFKEIKEEEGDQAIQFVKHLFIQSILMPFEVHPATRRLVIQIRGPWLSILVSLKLDSLFGNITDGLVIEKEVNRGYDEFFLKSIPGEKVLARSRPGDDEKELKSPVWLDPSTLEEVKMFDIKQRSDLWSVIKGVGLRKHALPTKVAKDLILFVSKSHFTIFNYKDNKIVSQLRTGSQMGENYYVKITNIGNLKSWTCSDWSVWSKLANFPRKRD